MIGRVVSGMRGSSEDHVRIVNSDKTGSYCRDSCSFFGLPGARRSSLLVKGRRVSRISSVAHFVTCHRLPVTAELTRFTPASLLLCRSRR